MNPPNHHDSNFDRQKLHDLTSAVMEGRASEMQQKELVALLKDNAEARDEYLNLVDMHGLLSTDLVPAPSKEDSVATTRGALKPWSIRRGFLLKLLGGLAIAASLIVISDVTMMFRFHQAQQQSETNPVAENSSASTQQNFGATGDATFLTIVQAKNPQWGEGSIFEVGDQLGATTIRLASGFVQLRYDTGVEVTLQGPAEFAAIDLAKAVLKSGLLTATVPPGAEGVTVDTPTAEVVDLGTSFGIDVRKDGFSDVTVFDGEVEVTPHLAPEKRLLTEGKSVRIGQKNQIHDVEFGGDRFEKLWPISSGIAGSTEAFRFIPPWPKQIRFVQSDQNIFVATEGYDLRLNQPLQLNISEPGNYSVAQDLTPAVVPVGDRIRSYILHFAPTEKMPARLAKRVQGSITFERPVIGLIVLHEELAATSQRFTKRNVGEFHRRRQLDLTGAANGDRVQLSDDRKTISVDLISPGRNTDLIRVIVEGNRRRHRLIGRLKKRTQENQP